VIKMNNKEFEEKDKSREIVFVIGICAVVGWLCFNFGLSI